MLRSDQLMNDLEVEGEFVTEKVMREEWGWTELLSNHKIIAELIFFKSHAHTHTQIPTAHPLAAFRTKIKAVMADCLKSPKTMMRLQWGTWGYNIEYKPIMCRTSMKRFWFHPQAFNLAINHGLWF